MTKELKQVPQGKLQMTHFACDVHVAKQEMQQQTVAKHRSWSKTARTVHGEGPFCLPIHHGLISDSAVHDSHTLMSQAIPHSRQCSY